jgi:hypothetical protein
MEQTLQGYWAKIMVGREEERIKKVDFWKSSKKKSFFKSWISHTRISAV